MGSKCHPRFFFFFFVGGTHKLSFSQNQYITRPEVQKKKHLEKMFQLLLMGDHAGSKMTLLSGLLLLGCCWMMTGWDAELFFF